MHDIKTFEGTLNNVGGRYALVVARFNSFVVEALLAGAVDTLVRHGVARDDIEIIRVPGAWELPVAVKKILEKRDYDAVIALGAVIRGGTAHFEYVAGEAAKGIAAVQNDTMFDASALLLANRTDCAPTDELNFDALLLGGYFCHREFIEKSLQLLYHGRICGDCAAFWTVRCVPLVFIA